MLAIGDGAIAVPGTEDGIDAGVEHGPRMRREFDADLLGMEIAQAAAEFLKCGGVEFGIIPSRRPGRRSGMFRAEHLHAVFDRIVPDAADGVSVHPDEVQIRFPGASCIAGALGHGGDAGGIEADIEDGVHHAGHRLGCPGAHRDQERLAAYAERAPGQLFEPIEVGTQLGLKVIGPALIVAIEVVAAFGGDGEAGRHIEAGAGHVREARPLAADEVLAIAVGVRVAVAEEIDPALGHRLILRGWCLPGSRRRGDCRTNWRGRARRRSRSRNRVGGDNRRRCA